jgi:iron complex transport system ATP-binding protein
MAATPQLSAEHVSVMYGTRRALAGVSLAASGGRVIGLLGPNGAGKTTLLRVLSGVLHPTSGRVLLDGDELGRLASAERARRIAVVPQRAAIPEGFRVAEIVLMGRAPHLGWLGAEGARDHAAAERAMRLTETLDLATRPATELSGGEQQRVLLARALAQEPAVLLLDEATVHLDLRHQAHMLEIVGRLADDGMLVIAALHDLNLAAQYADRLVLLDGGELVADGSPRDVLTAERLRAVYGVDVLVGTHPLSGAPTVGLIGPRRPA